MDELAQQVVDALNDLTGKHAGHRAAHAKGTLMAGTFTPSGAGLTTAAHMSGDPVPVTVRFSNGSGNPHAADYAQEGRGMAVKFYLPDGSRTDVVMLDQPCFFARTPEDFLEFARARKPDPETRRAGHGEGGCLPRRAPRGAAQHPVLPVHHAAGELRDLRVQLAPLVPLDRRRRQLAVRSLPLRAGGRREQDRRGGGEGARPRVPPGGHRGARRRGLPAARGDRRRR